MYLLRGICYYCCYLLAFYLFSRLVFWWPSKEQTKPNHHTCYSSFFFFVFFRLVCTLCSITLKCIIVFSVFIWLPSCNNNNDETTRLEKMQCTYIGERWRGKRVRCITYICTYLTKQHFVVGLDTFHFNRTSNFFLKFTKCDVDEMTMMMLYICDVVLASFLWSPPRVQFTFEIWRDRTHALMSYT